MQPTLETLRNKGFKPLIMETFRSVTKTVGNIPLKLGLHKQTILYLNIDMPLVLGNANGLEQIRHANYKTNRRTK